MTTLNIDAKRKQANLSKTEFSRRSGVDYGTIVRFCKIKQIKTLILLDSIATGLNCTVADLLLEIKDDSSD